MMEGHGHDSDSNQRGLFDTMFDAQWAVATALSNAYLSSAPARATATAIEHAWTTLVAAGYRLDAGTAPTALESIDGLVARVLWNYSPLDLDDSLLVDEICTPGGTTPRYRSVEEQLWLARLADAYDLVYGAISPLVDRLAGLDRRAREPYMALEPAPWLSASFHDLEELVGDVLGGCREVAPPPTQDWFVGGWPRVMSGDLDDVFARNAWRMVRRDPAMRLDLHDPTLALDTAIVLRIAFAGLVEVALEEEDDRSVAMWVEDWWSPALGSERPPEAWTDEAWVWRRLRRALPNVIAALERSCAASEVDVDDLFRDPHGTRAVLAGYDPPNEDERVDGRGVLAMAHPRVFYERLGELLVSEESLIPW